MTLTIQDLGALGELLGWVAVLVTLVYLALQTRQNTMAISAQLDAARIAALLTMNLTAATSTELQEALGEDQIDAPPMNERRRNDEITDWVLEFRNQLAGLYRDSADSSLAELKQDNFTQMKTQYDLISNAGNGTPFFDWWFSLELNNAHLVSLATYHQLVPAFSALLEQTDSFDEFYEAAKELEKIPKDERNSQIQALKPVAR